MTTNLSKAGEVSGDARPRNWFLRGSAWEDQVWTFTPTNRREEEEPARLKWRFQLPNGTLFTDPKYHRQLEACKALLEVLCRRPTNRGSAMRATSVAGIGYNMRFLIRWMQLNDVIAFREIDHHAAKDFLRWLARVPTVKGKKRSKSTIQQCADCLLLLFQYRAELPDGILTDPFPGTTVARAIGRKDSDNKRLPYTPAFVASNLVLASLGILSEASEILRARQDYADMARGSGLRTKEACFNACLCGGQYNIKASPYIGLGSLEEMEVATYALYAACYVILSYLVGLRRSELMLLEAGCVMPLNADQTGQLQVIRGSIIKGEAHYLGRTHEWLAPPEAVRAIEVLEALSMHMRLKSGRRQLWLKQGKSFAHSRNLLDANQRGIRLARLESVNFMLRWFAERLDLRDEEGKPWHLSSHQGRKTFARFAALRDRTSLFALARHLGHRDRAITEQGYAGTDYQLELEIRNGIVTESIAAWEQMLAATRLGGKAGNEIVTKRPRFRGANAKGEIKKYARMLVEAGLVLGVCDWGFCVYRQEYSACHGTITEPNPVEREPGTCARCKNFAVNERHRPYWEEQRDRHVALQNAPGTSMQTRAIAVMREQEARRILHELEKS